ncbi:agmatine deiminase family protein, partial [Streptomyces lavendulae]|uniref:agmatine deiminase family protein n=1 Tax=Streptomyces lavendulae TaxID=1914 RepID=UPI0036974175
MTTNKPTADGFRMPAEWTPHERTWMAWPSPNPTFTNERELAEAREAWGAVARAVRSYEPVTLVVSPGDADSARARGGQGGPRGVRGQHDPWKPRLGPTVVTHHAGGEA